MTRCFRVDFDIDELAAMLDDIYDPDDPFSGPLDPLTPSESSETENDEMASDEVPRAHTATSPRKPRPRKEWVQNENMTKRQNQRYAARLKKATEEDSKPMPWGGRLNFPSQLRVENTQTLKVAFDAESLRMANGAYVGIHQPRSSKRPATLEDLRNEGYEVLPWDGW